MLNKGQATVFIILALIIGVTILGAYYTNEYLLKSEFERNLEKSAIVPEKAQKIYDFTTNCIEETTEQAIEIIGLQGGYIDLVQNPYDSPVLDTPETKTAFWAFEAPNKIQKTSIPSEDIIQKEIAKYIDANLKFCLNNYEDFEQYEIKVQEPKTQTQIKANQVLTKTELNLKIKIKDFEFDFKPFYTKIKTPLGYLYEEAQKILHTAQTENFLEKKTIDAMSVSPEIPFRETTNDCQAPFWLKNVVMQNLKEIININTAFLKIKNTNYQLSNKEHKYYEIDSDLNDKDLDVNFQYLKSWPMHFEVYPEENGILKAESMTENLGPVRAIAESFTCMSVMNFIYNIKYPVLVNLYKDGYNFRFVTEAIIDRNEPKINTDPTIEIPEINNKYCKNKLFNIDLEVLDENQNPIPDADVSYQCASYVCELGKTGSAGELKEKTIPCINGQIIVSKKDYQTEKQTTSTNTDIALTMNMEGYKELKIIPQIQRAGSGEIRKDEQIIIQMQELEKQYSVSIIYPDEKTIKLIPGTYKTQIYLVSKHPEGIKVGDQTIQLCTEVPKKGISGILNQKEEVCKAQKIEGFTVNQVTTGSAEGEFTISDFDLTNNAIKFYIPYVGMPDTIEEMSRTTSKFVEPVFENE